MKSRDEQKPKQSQETESVARACYILSALEGRGQPARLRDIVDQTHISKATAFRILATLQRHGYVIKTPPNGYLPAVARIKQQRIRIGYAAQSEEFAFSRAVTESIVASAGKAGIDLFVLNNQYSRVIALQNAEAFIKEGVNLIMEFQTDSSIAPLLSAKFWEKRVPLIAIEIPHPNATYFGMNNPQAGLCAGRYLGHWAEANWKRRVGEVILLGLPMAGYLPGSRLTGALLGMQEILPFLEDSQVRVLSGNGRFQTSYDVLRQYLKKSLHERILVCGINDPSALGALQAFRDAGRENHCAIVGHNGSSDAISEMRHSATRLIGSVGCFPEKYGEQLIALALQLIDHKAVSPAVLVKHHLITPQNLRDYYPLVKTRTRQRKAATAPSPLPQA